jgi:small subunit ribosomal protein S10
MMLKFPQKKATMPTDKVDKPKYVTGSSSETTNLYHHSSVLTPWDPPSESQEREWASTVVHGRSIYKPYRHPRTYNIPVALLHFRAHSHEVLDRYGHFATHVASALGIPTSSVIPLPTQRSLWTVIRGPFAHKKSQENFERKVYKRAIKAWDADPEVIDRWLKYLQMHEMPGMGVRVVRWERVPVGIGKLQLKNVTEQMRLASVVRALGDKIVTQETAAAQENLQIPQTIEADNNSKTA